MLNKKAFAFLLLSGLVACSPGKHRFRDRLRQAGLLAVASDEDDFDIPEDIHVKAAKPAVKLDGLQLPRFSSDGEMWLPRTLLTRDLKIEWNKDRTRVVVKGSAQWNNQSMSQSGDRMFVLAGDWNAERGITDLVEVLKDRKNQKINSTIRGKIFCMNVNDEGQCDSVVIELFVKDNGVIFSGQFEKQDKKKTKPTPIPQDLKPSKEEEIDDELEGFDQDLEVVGTSQKELDELYKRNDIQSENDQIVPPPPEVAPQEPGDSSTDAEVKKILETVGGDQNPPTDGSEEEGFNGGIPAKPKASAKKGAAANDVGASPKPQVAPKLPAPSPSAPDLATSSPVSNSKASVPLVGPPPPLAPTISAPISPAKDNPAKDKVSAPEPKTLKPEAIKPETLKPETLKAELAKGDKAKIDKTKVEAASVDAVSEDSAKEQPAAVEAKLKAEFPAPKIVHESESAKPSDSSIPKGVGTGKSGEIVASAPGASAGKVPPSKAAINDNPVDDDSSIPIVKKDQDRPTALKSDQQKPSNPKYNDQSIGAHSRGSLRNGTSLKAVVDKMGDRATIRVVRPEQNRFFGNYASIEFLVRSAILLNRIDSGHLLEVGDLSAQRGGHLSPHKSHQNGLDMDIGFFFDGMKEDYYGRNAVAGKRLDKKFDQTLQWKFFKSLVTHYHDQIYFILIHPLVKKAMCQEAVKAGDLAVNGDKEVDPIVEQTLRRLVPERSHDDHFHVRLKCPAKDTRCSQTTRDLPMTMGCIKKK